MIDLTGQRFTRLLVLRVSKKRYRGGIIWLCRCDCGKQLYLTSNKLRTGHTQSCGCLRLEALARNRSLIDNVRHGHAIRDAKSRTYSAWCAMKSRCYDPNHAGGRAWKEYGGRGIKVCNRWLNSFENFLADMGEKPEGDYLLDRKNNDRGYMPSNCRWATRAESIVNQRSHGPKKS